MPKYILQFSKIKKNPKNPKKDPQKNQNSVNYALEHNFSEL